MSARSGPRVRAMTPEQKQLRDQCRRAGMGPYDTKRVLEAVARFDSPVVRKHVASTLIEVWKAS